MKIIEGKGEPRDQVESAIKEVFGQDREITEVDEELGWLGNSFPRHATYFHVTSISLGRPWHDHVFHCRNRCIVLTEDEMAQTKMATIAKALTEE